MQLTYSGYILLALLVLFYSRKILFWALFIGENSDEGMKVWEKREMKNRMDKNVE
jgi:hypothetical protein